MQHRQGSIVLVVRMWHDDGGVRAILQTSVRPGEAAYASVDDLLQALQEIIEGWQPVPDRDADVRRLGPE